MEEFTLPSFLKKLNTEYFHKLELDALPSNIDKSKGGFVWDFTRPTALVAAMMCEYVLADAIQLAFPQYSYGEYLDAHAATRSITRRPAVAASGYLTITGTPGTAISSGTMFSTPAMNGYPAVDYKVTSPVIIPDSGTVSAYVMCTQTGVIGNSPAGTVKLISSKISGISSVTNDNDMTGGTEEESDDDLRERIVDFDRSQGSSFVGSAADYKRWAKSVAGVGEAIVIPATDNTGLVTIVITDIEGKAANESLCTDVYNYIMQPDDPGARLAPINAKLSVEPPDIITINITATIELRAGATIGAVTQEFTAALVSYFQSAQEEGEVKYSSVFARLSNVSGVNDCKDLSINSGTANISINSGELPTVGTLTLNVSTWT